MVFIALAILIAILVFTGNHPVKNKEGNIQLPLAATQGAHKHEGPYLQSFEVAGHERAGVRTLGPFLASILLQKPSHTIYGSAVAHTAENVDEIDNPRMSDSPSAVSLPDIIIMLMVVFMLFFFVTKVF